MGAINLDNTGSGGAITLSSDGTSLLLGGSAVGGGGGADLYAANESSPTAQPSATGANAIAIGDSSVASGQRGTAIGFSALASGFNSVSIGNGEANNSNSIAIGLLSLSTAGQSIAVGYNAVSVGSSSHASTDSYASGSQSFAAAIGNNTSTYGAKNTNSVALGRLAKATGAYSIAISSNTYSGSATASGSGAVAIGDGPTASGIGSTSIGRGCTASGTNSIAMGRDAQATQETSVAIGYRAYSDVIGGIAFAGSGWFGAANGDAQGRMYILRRATTDATPAELGATAEQVKVPTNGAVVFDGLITGLESGVNSYAGWKIEGMIVNDGGTTTLVNSAITTIHNTPSWGLSLAADDTNDRLAIEVTGEASHNIRWVGNIRTVETIYA
jgi:hypothetical protein